LNSAVFSFSTTVRAVRDSLRDAAQFFARKWPSTKVYETEQRTDFEAFHIGQFADFPAGFNHNGQDIPASFTGALTPQTRTTARFAIAITFKGLNIPTGSAKSSGQATSQNNTK
jgi:hypothetical protein